MKKFIAVLGVFILIAGILLWQKERADHAC